MINRSLLAFILIFNLNFVTIRAELSHIQRHLIGVNPRNRNHYELTSDQDFRCLDGSRSIPLDYVNDNYCDCNDASDEPGTPGCSHGQFYCANQGYLEKSISSAWVNDGQCDCCDASDEYNSTASCENTCGVLGEMYRQEQERTREISDKGSAIRKQYKDQARQRREQNSQLLDQYKRELSEKQNAIKTIEDEMNSDFGPSQVFFPLKGQCYAYKDREYTYTLCPFERATQESTAGMQTELGRWAGWVGPTENPYSRMKYEGGVQCWNGPARSTVVNIACGVEDKIISVTEPAKCEYVYDFITPAACPDTDPEEPEAQPAQETGQGVQEAQGDGAQAGGQQEREVEEDGHLGSVDDHHTVVESEDGVPDPIIESHDEL